MPHPLTLFIAATLIVAGFVFPPLAGYPAAYTTIVAALFTYAILLPRYWDVLGLWPMRMLGFAFGPILITLPFVYQSDSDLFVLIALLPTLVAPAAAIALREETRFLTPTVIGFAFLCGAIAALGIALNDTYLLGVRRAGGGNNPIHFAGLAAILGYAALLGLYGNKSPWRFGLFLGPVFATMAIGYSGSRGPMLASMAMALVAFPFLAKLFWSQGRRTALGGLIGMVILLGIAGVSAANDSRARSIIGQVTGVMTQTENIDGSTEERLILYHAALEAFQHSPIFGHGAGQLASAAREFMPEEYVSARKTGHLHNDIADFAVTSGTLGLLAYALLLLAPFTAAWQTADKAMRQCVFLGACLLSGGYFVLGMTNAVFGLLPQTVLYGLLLGVLAGFSQQRLEP